MMMNKKIFSTTLRYIVHAAGWAPLIRIAIGLLTNHLTYNPIQKVEQITGIAGLVFLLLSLACTPLSFITGWQQLTQRRKALGLYGFLYATLHIATFIAVDYGLNLNLILTQTAGKDYFIVGGAAFLLLLPVAATSFKYWMKKLGKNWKRLHWLVYLVSPLVIYHYMLVVKGNITRLQGNLIIPLEYAFIAVVLLVLRLEPVRRKVIAVRVFLQTAIRTGYIHVRMLLSQSH
jgi:sulfoxide reductase heme-binding subunit YedZ